jgi:hypothetical protein
VFAALVAFQLEKCRYFARFAVYTKTPKSSRLSIPGGRAHREAPELWVVRKTLNSSTAAGRQQRQTDTKT